MIKLSEKSRRVLRTIYRGLGVTAVSLVFQACYGPVMPDEVYIYGSVQSQETNAPIKGIKVSVEDANDHSFTNSNGEYSLYLPIQDSYTVKFEDVDGIENGGLFKQHTADVSFIEDTYAELNVELKADKDE